MLGIINTLNTDSSKFKVLGKYYNPFTLPIKQTPLLLKQIEWLKKNDCSNIIIISDYQNQEIKKLLNFYKLNEIKVTEEKPNIKRYNEDILILNSNLILVETFLKKNDFNNSFFIGDKKTKDILFLKNSKELNSDKDLVNIKHLENKVDFIVINSLEDYLNNKSISLAREFNKIKFTETTVEKSSLTKREKIIDEYNWFNNMPDHLKRYCPKVLDQDLYAADGSMYTMEKLIYSPLDKIMLFESNDSGLWNDIFEKLFKCFKDFNATEVAGEGSFMRAMYKKTVDRLKGYPSHITKDEKLIEEFMPIFKDICKKEDAKGYSTIIHGDFCFGNIMYKTEEAEVKVIDPRGSLWGSYLYEMAKLYKSIVGNYYYTDYELYAYNKESDEFYLYNQAQKEIQIIFDKFINENFEKEEIKNFYITVSSLFLSMVPYHPHNPKNQTIFYREFERLFKYTKENIL